MREILRFVEQPRQCSYLPEETASLEVRCSMDMSPAELTDVEERKRSPIARRRFGVLLRSARRTEDTPLTAVLRAARKGRAMYRDFAR